LGIHAFRDPNLPRELIMRALARLWIGLRPAVLLLLLLAGSSAAQSVVPIASDAEPYRPRYQLPKGEHVLVVYIGMTGCGHSRDPELRKAVREMKPHLADQARSLKKPLSIVGVSLDWDVDSGIVYLQGLGAWDEIVTGGNWAGTGPTTFIWEVAGVKPQVPQILIFSRTVTQQPPSGMQIDPKQLRRRIVGTDSIIAWARSGAPVEIQK
jgi:hypothetical protein